MKKLMVFVFSMFALSLALPTFSSQNVVSDNTTSQDGVVVSTSDVAFLSSTSLFSSQSGKRDK